MSGTSSLRNAPQAERRARVRLGHWAEALAALTLTLKGYRILERRCKTRLGEIDLIAVRGSTLAFVEVKARATLSDAQDSLSARQMARCRRAALLWIASRRGYQHHEQRFDAVFVVGAWWPIHMPGCA